MSFNIISTFSGCGGSSLGYQLAGGKVLLAIEWDDNAVETYKANFPNTQIYHSDIAQLSIDKILEITKLKPKELDILDGSPPCQGFSTTGKRNFHDSRNQLFIEYCRILKGLQPKCFVMENVSGMIKGNMKLIFVDILKALKECGYKVKCKLLNAKNFNVPQSRQRLIFIGVRNDINIEPSHPQGTTKLINLKTALNECVSTERLKPTNKFLLSILDKLKQGETAAKYHPKNHHFSSMRVAWNKPSPTICKSTIGVMLHPDLNESLSIEEIKRIGSFPDNFVFLGTFKEKWARIGNSVPPLFMKAIAQHIYENILKKI